MNPINPKGIVHEIRKHSKNRTQIKNILQEISMYDLKSSKSVVVFVGGNDASSSTDIKLFEEYYDQLISLIKTGNP